MAGSLRIHRSITHETHTTHITTTTTTPIPHTHTHPTAAISEEHARLTSNLMNECTDFTNKTFSVESIMCLIIQFLF